MSYFAITERKLVEGGDFSYMGWGALTAYDQVAIINDCAKLSIPYPGTDFGVFELECSDTVLADILDNDEIHVWQDDPEALATFLLDREVTKAQFESYALCLDPNNEALQAAVAATLDYM